MTPRKRRIYIALVVMGTAAFLLDRFMLAPVAQTAVARPSNLSDLGIDSQGSAPVDVANTPFPRRLPRIDFHLKIRDAFAITPETQVKLFNGQRLDGLDSGSRGKPRIARAKEFKQSHKISAVLISSTETVVVVSGRWLHVGDSMDGCTLQSVHETSATFDCAGQAVRLSVLGQVGP